MTPLGFFYNSLNSIIFFISFSSYSTPFSATGKSSDIVPPNSFFLIFFSEMGMEVLPFLNRQEYSTNLLHISLKTKSFSR